MPTTAIVRALRSISSMTSGSFMLRQLQTFDEPSPLFDSFHPILAFYSRGIPSLKIEIWVTHLCRFTGAGYPRIPDHRSLPLHIHLLIRRGRHRRAPTLGQQVPAEERLQIS